MPSPEAARSTVAGPSRGLFSPATAFSLVLAMIVVVDVAGWLQARSLDQHTRSGASADAPAGTAAPGSGAIPADAALLERFSELRALWIRAYRERDVSLVRLYAAPDAPRLTETDEIRWLLRHEVLDRSRWLTRRMTVYSRSSDRVVIRERLLFVPRFIDEVTGRNASPGEPPQRQTILWTMRRYGGDWRLYEARAIKAKELAPRRSS